MIRSRLKGVLEECFDRGVAEGAWSAAGTGRFALELPKHEGQGDYATNMALVLAGIEKANPRQLAAKIAAMLEKSGDLVDRVEVAGPGFVNIFLRPGVWREVIPQIIAGGRDFGRSTIGGGRKVMVEFVSANPTGPLTVGHGRNAVLGDAVASLLTAVGWNVIKRLGGQRDRIRARPPLPFSNVEQLLW